MDWQPIETAPRNGTQILVVRDGRISIAAWCSETRGPGASEHIQEPGWIAYCDGGEVENEGWDTGHGFAYELKDVEWGHGGSYKAPTHWMPLPDPPTALP